MFHTHSYPDNFCLTSQKWLCGLQDVAAVRAGNRDDYGVGKFYPKSCIVYSMGSSNEFSFEERVREVAPGCEIHTFDPTVRETGKGKLAYDSYHYEYGFGGEDSDHSL
jgi:hypothetical protein